MKCSVIDPATSNPLTNHAVAIVGYKLDSTVDPDCKGYFIIKNSWGTTWGENGYGKVCIPKDETTLKAGTCNIQHFFCIPNIGAYKK